MAFDFKRIAKLLLPRYQKLILEYPVEMKPRLYPGNPAFEKLFQIIENQNSIYVSFLNDILTHREIFYSIQPSNLSTQSDKPTWNNGFLPGLDIMALYAMVARFKPRNYVEIGSGNSTRVVRLCIDNKDLSTRITSTDPFPRAEIDHLAHNIIRLPLEEVDYQHTIINDLEENDILFIDNSHRCLPNSDVTVCMLEILPVLKPGVIVHLHDIYLPWDYPQEMCDRFYTEQYLLAAVLMAQPQRYKAIFPAWYISRKPDLSGVLNEIWEHPSLEGVEKHGGSFWIKIC